VRALDTLGISAKTASPFFMVQVARRSASLLDPIISFALATPASNAFKISSRDPKVGGLYSFDSGESKSRTSPSTIPGAQTDVSAR
jgi:hypothetical protein